MLGGVDGTVVVHHPLCSVDILFALLLVEKGVTCVVEGMTMVA